MYLYHFTINIQLKILKRNDTVITASQFNFFKQPHKLISADSCDVTTFVTSERQNRKAGEFVRNLVTTFARLFQPNR